jgi:hypothetical protein
MSDHSSALDERFPNLFRRFNATGLSSAIAGLDPEVLAREYACLRQSAPKRSDTGKPYFRTRADLTEPRALTNRLEEHTAIAMLSLDRYWPWPGGGWLRLLDYQVPLKGKRDDKLVGKLDLLGVNNEDRLVVIELKVQPKSGGQGDPPATALMEALRYAAMVEADLAAIRTQALGKFGARISNLPPIIAIIGPTDWWRCWGNLSAAGAWPSALAGLINSIRDRTGVHTECLAFDDFEIQAAGAAAASRPQLRPTLYQVELGGFLEIGNRLPPFRQEDKARAKYLTDVENRLCAWADQHLMGKLDGRRRVRGRPPVLQREFVDQNLVVPADDERADEIRGCIPPAQRHRHFGSLRSSQALAQSVFGTIRAYRCYKLLRGITADCGRPAFLDAPCDWKIELEHEVRSLGEPRPTSIDVLMCNGSYRVAVECKFTEAEFGRCSRPGLTPQDRAYHTQFCNGDYLVQAGRQSRCALTEIGVLYWDFLPTLFNWPRDADQTPCQFGKVYQLARNALAVGHASYRGHALVVYDANNPAFLAGGAAITQWEIAVAAIRQPGRLRRISWQKLINVIGGYADLKEFSANVSRKYFGGLTV